MKEVEASVRFGTLRWLSQEEKQKTKNKKKKRIYIPPKFFFWGKI